jgi:hypothetical protein
VFPVLKHTVTERISFGTAILTFSNKKRRNKEMQAPPPPSFQAAENKTAGRYLSVQIHRQESLALFSHS